VRVKFRGTAFRWITMRGPDQGRAAVYIDGKLRATFDEYAQTRDFRVTAFITGLTDAVHMVRIVVLGTSKAASSGTWVSVDGFDFT
jgi:hypothetical protein